MAIDSNRPAGASNLVDSGSRRGFQVQPLTGKMKAAPS
jgi:hypothetical protein